MITLKVLMMKILLLSRYTRMGSSSRLRLLQYLPLLRSRGIDVDVSPLLDDDYLARLYAGEPCRRRPLLMTYLNRVHTLAATLSGRYDLLWIEKELFPGLPAWAEWVIRKLGAPYVVDFDDATFHYYDCHCNPFVRSLMCDKIDRVMRGAALVVAGNEYIAERARRAGAARVEILPTVIDLPRYCTLDEGGPAEGQATGDAPAGESVQSAIPEQSPQPAPFTIGWIGAPCTARYLEEVGPALAEVCAGGNARVVLVGSGPICLEGVPCEVREWSEASEVAAICSFDVGIMPLPDAPWERGKCGYKLIQYMACEKPVVASAIGINAEIVADGCNGFLARNHDDWVRALETLRRDPRLRARMGRCGRSRVEANYCVQVTGPKLVDLLREASGPGRGRGRQGL